MEYIDYEDILIRGSLLLLKIIVIIEKQKPKELLINEFLF